MSARELIEGGFIPERAVDAMSRTKPGRLAAILDQILYDGRVEDFAWLKDMPSVTGKRFHVGDRVYCSTAKQGDGADGYHNVENTLRDVRDYLEACALKEAIR